MEKLRNDTAWKLIRLGEICIRGNGLQTGPFGSQLHASEYTEEGIPVVMPKDLTAGRISYEDVAHIPEHRAKDLKKHKLIPGDIVFARRGDIGRCALVTSEEEGWICGTGCLRARPSKKVIPAFLIYALGTPKAVDWLNANAVGQTMLNLNTSILASLPIQLPPLSEQRKIAEILGTWDKAIALTERRIEAAQQRKKALMQQLLTGRVRFPEFEEEEWREVRLGKIFTERKERGYEDLPLLSVTANEGIIYRDELDRRDTSSADKSKYLRVCKGDIAYNTMRMWQGRSGVSKLEGIVSPAYTVCKPKPSIDSDFAGYLFQLPSTIYLFRRYSQGLVSDTWNLKFRHFAEIRVKIPDIAEQRRIADVLQTCDREIELLAQKRDALQRQKKGLMQQLLTGRVRVQLPLSNSPQGGED